ncbi:cytochrome P450 [Trichoderma ceciliae]
MATTPIIQSLIALVGYIIYHQLLRKPRKNLPPGPKGLPLIGNILDLPPKETPDYEHWNSVANKYGPISSITVLGQTMIFITDKEATLEILEKKSSASSGRPIFQFSNYCGFGAFMSLLQLGKQLKSFRKIMHKGLGTRLLVAKYADIQELEVGRLLLRTLKAPQQIRQHLKTEANAVVFKLLYSYTVNPKEIDPLVELNDRVTTNFVHSAIPFGRLIEFIPAVKWLPDGFPGTGFKALAKQYNQELHAVVDEPYKFVRKQMANRNSMNSFVAKLIQEYTGDADELTDDDAYTIKWSAAGLQAGGAETTNTSLSSFILAMMMFPEAQRKAQEEVDRVTGGTRLPVLADREQMPFVEAMVTETLRWFPLLPMGAPHMLSEDMTYKGYDLPKGAYVFSMTWGFAHDPSVYADPHRFAPERFLAPRNETDPRWAIFGVGRRVCPGRHLADSALFVNMANLVAVFDITKAIDEQGNVLEPKLEILAKSDPIAKPKPFPYNITPRSEKHVELIKQRERDHPWEEDDAWQLGHLPTPPSH